MPHTFCRGLRGAKLRLCVRASARTAFGVSAGESTRIPCNPRRPEGPRRGRSPGQPQGRNGQYAVLGAAPAHMTRQLHDAEFLERFHRAHAALDCRPDRALLCPPFQVRVRWPLLPPLSELPELRRDLRKRYLPVQSVPHPFRSEPGNPLPCPGTTDPARNARKKTSESPARESLSYPANSR